MGLVRSALDLIRSFFAKKEEPLKQAEQLARGASVETEASFFARYGMSGLYSYFLLPQSLLERYNDYEQMVTYPLISSALNIYADNITIPSSSTGHRVWIETGEDEIKELLENFLYKDIEIDTQVWGWARNTCKYGNYFLEILTHPTLGVVGVNNLPVATMRRVHSDKGRLVGFAQDMTKSGSDIDYKQLEAWLKAGKTRTESYILFRPEQIVHFRITSYGDAVLPQYGESILESARWLWRRLLILEDSVIVYRLTRSPQKYLVYVDVGNKSPNEVRQYLERIKTEFNKKKFIDPETKQLSTRYSPLASDENFFIAIQGEKDQTRIEPLATPTWDYLEDVNYFKNMIFAALRVPKAYLTYDEDVRAKATLAVEDINFANTVSRIQIEIRRGIKQLCDIYLASRNIAPDSINYEVRMVSPSQIYETMETSLRSARLELASAYKEWANDEWILKNILKYTDREIEELKKEREIIEKSAEVEKRPENKISIDELPFDASINKIGRKLDEVSNAKLMEQLQSLSRKVDALYNKVMFNGNQRP